MSFVSGTRLGRYEIRPKLGEGGMGELDRAYDDKINREVAIKVLPAALSSDKDRPTRFEQVAQGRQTTQTVKFIIALTPNFFMDNLRPRQLCIPCWEFKIESPAIFSPAQLATALATL